MVSGGEKSGQTSESWRMDADQVSKECEDRRLIQHDPMFHPVSQSLGRLNRVFTEPASNVAIGKSSPILQCLRKIPMKQRGKRGYACGEQLVHQAVVKVESPGIRFSVAFGKNPRPGNGKTVSLDAQVSHQCDIFSVTVIVVTGDVAGLRALDLVWGVSKGVPDRRRSSIFRNSTLNLIAGSGCSP
jgi:hypothetical protein